MFPRKVKRRGFELSPRSARFLVALFAITALSGSAEILAAPPAQAAVDQGGDCSLFWTFDECGEARGGGWGDSGPGPANGGSEISDWEEGLGAVEEREAQEAAERQEKQASDTEDDEADQKEIEDEEEPSRVAEEVRAAQAEREAKEAECSALPAKMTAAREAGELLVAGALEEVHARCIGAENAQRRFEVELKKLGLPLPSEARLNSHPHGGRHPRRRRGH